MNQESSAEKTILAILVVVLGLVSVVSVPAAIIFFNRANEAEIGESVAKKHVADADRDIQNVSIEINSMHKMMGVPRELRPEEVQATLEADLQKYAPDLPNDQRNYRQALEYLWRKSQAGQYIAPHGKKLGCPQHLFRSLSFIIPRLDELNQRRNGLTVS